MPLIRIAFSLLFVVFIGRLSAQVVINEQESKGIIYNKEGVLTGTIHPNGWAIGYKQGKLKTYYLTKFWSFEIGEIRNSKEYKQRNEFNLPLVSGGSSSPKSFAYGKQNNFLVARVGYGEKRYLTDKATVKGVVVGYSWELGGSLGMLKPYYLELINRLTDPPTIDAVKYSEETKSTFLDYGSIYGSSSFLKGLDEISFVPGAYGRLGLHFDWGAFDELVKSVDVGIMLDAYPKKINIMANQENRPFFLNLYVHLQLGKRW